MERQKREHQESSAQAAEKHSRQLKDLGKDHRVCVTARRHTVAVFAPISLLLHTCRDVLQPEADGGAREVRGAAAEV